MINRKPAKQKPRKTHPCPVCGEQFVKHNGLTQKTCFNASCALTYSRAKTQEKNIKAELVKDKTARSITRKRKADVKPLSHWIDLTRRVVNDYIRERDAYEPCISCGTTKTWRWDAGHYRTTAAAAHIQFNEDNIHKQCMPCNTHHSGKTGPYRINLVKKIGEERVQALENNNETHRYTREELAAIRKEFSAKRRALIKMRDAA